METGRMCVRVGSSELVKRKSNHRSCHLWATNAFWFTRHSSQHGFLPTKLAIIILKAIEYLEEQRNFEFNDLHIWHSMRIKVGLNDLWSQTFDTIIDMLNRYTHYAQNNWNLMMWFKWSLSRFVLLFMKEKNSYLIKIKPIKMIASNSFWRYTIFFI